ncbi:amidase [Roseovarius pacificus]|uniref:amidase n=1 Tax=Roseovarius pacificus TaxID=337701 RepID=UPI004039E8C8
MSRPRTATAIARAIACGKLTATEAVHTALERAEEISPLNAFTVIDWDGALAAARNVDEGKCRDAPLLGVPFAAKDFTPTAGHLTTRGSWSTGDAVPDTDPVYVQRLKAAGAILIGKTTTPEFAYSSFTQSPRWGVTRNPHDPEHSPGGSSGGAAVAVATGCVPIAEGTDMGGSVRIPAALSGVVGLKPSLGRIPIDILPLGPDMISHFGPLAASVDDAALFLSVTQGPHPSDILSQPDPQPIDTIEPAHAPRIALSEDLGYYHVAPEIRARLADVASELRTAGATVEPVDIGWTRVVNDTWLKLWGVALAASWEDGLSKYGNRMDPELVALMEDGRRCSGVELRRLEALRNRLWLDLATLFTRYDVLITPTCAVTAPRLDETDADYERTDLSGRFAGLDMTCPFNLLSPCPALSVPVGTANGLPVGLQIIGPRFADLDVLRLGKLVEQCFPPLPPVTGSFADIQGHENRS